MANEYRTIPLDSGLYTVTIANLNDREYRKVMDALDPLRVAPLVSVDLTIEATPEVLAHITGVETLTGTPAVSIAGEDPKMHTPRLVYACAVCGHHEADHTGPVIPGASGGACGAGNPAIATGRCPCRGYHDGREH